MAIDYQDKNITLSRKGNISELGDADIELPIKKIKESFAFRIGELKIGSLEFYNIPATTYSADQEHIILGNKFLKKFLLVLDYPGGKIILKKNGTPFETNISSYGIGITKYGNKTIEPFSKRFSARPGIKLKADRPIQD